MNTNSQAEVQRNWRSTSRALLALLQQHSRCCRWCALKLQTVSALCVNARQLAARECRVGVSTHLSLCPVCHTLLADASMTGVQSDGENCACVREELLAGHSVACISERSEELLTFFTESTIGFEYDRDESPLMFLAFFIILEELLFFVRFRS